jgi:hypothetical protein
MNLLLLIKVAVVTTTNGADDLTVGEVIGSECSDNVQFATASSAPSALSDTFMLEDITNYVGQREQFVDNCGPQNETHCARVFKMFFDELVELIVRETNTYAAQKYKPEVSFHCVSECWTGNLSLIKTKSMLC